MCKQLFILLIVFYNDLFSQSYESSPYMTIVGTTPSHLILLYEVTVFQTIPRATDLAREILDPSKHETKRLNHREGVL